MIERLQDGGQQQSEELKALHRDLCEAVGKTSVERVTERGREGEERAGTKVVDV